MENNSLFEIKIDYDKIHISQGNNKSIIMGYLGKLEAREININEYVEIDSQKFLKAITDCQKCLSKEVFKPTLKGVYFYFENTELNTVKLVTTDGR